jgi:hypothetical protein
VHYRFACDQLSDAFHVGYQHVIVTHDSLQDTFEEDKSLQLVASLLVDVGIWPQNQKNVDVQNTKQTEQANQLFSGHLKLYVPKQIAQKVKCPQASNCQINSQVELYAHNKPGSDIEHKFTRLKPGRHALGIDKIQSGQPDSQ